METQLQEIIDRIHTEGVKSAEERSREIIAHADKQAQDRIREAEENARRIVQQAEQEAARSRAAGESALQQAGRDLLLSIHQDIEQLFSRLVREAVGEALSPEQTATILARLIAAWPNAENDDVTVLLSEKDLKAVEQSMRKELSESLRDRVVLRPVRGISAGFRIGTGEGAAFFDVTDGTLADLLAAFLNPRLAKLLRSADQG